MANLTYEVTVLVSRSVGIYQCTSDREPIATSTTSHEVRAAVTFSGPSEDASVVWLDAAVVEDLELSANELIGAEERAVDLGAQAMFRDQEAQKAMAKAWNDRADAAAVLHLQFLVEQLQVAKDARIEHKVPVAPWRHGLRRGPGRSDPQ